MLTFLISSILPHWILIQIERVWPQITAIAFSSVSLSHLSRALTEGGTLYPFERGEKVTRHLDKHLPVSENGGNSLHSCYSVELCLINPWITNGFRKHNVIFAAGSSEVQFMTCRCLQDLRNCMRSWRQEYDIPTVEWLLMTLSIVVKELYIIFPTHIIGLASKKKTDLAPKGSGKCSIIWVILTHELAVESMEGD